MAKQRINWKFVIVVTIGALVLAATIFALHQRNRRRGAESALSAGNQAFQEKRWTDAAENLRRYISAAPQDVDVLMKFAEAHLNIRPMQANNLQQAMAAWRTVLRIDKDRLDAADKLVAMYIQLNVPGEAEFIARQFLETHSDVKMRRMLGVSLVLQRKFQEAQSLLTKVIEDHPDDILAYDLLAQLAGQRSEEFEVDPEHYLNLAVRNNPSSALARLVRAGYQIRHGNVPAALADFERAEKLDMSDVAIRLRLATHFIELGMLQRARGHLNIVQEADPANLDLWQRWGMLVKKADSKPEMASVAQQGLDHLAPDSWDFMPAAIELFARAGRYDEAKDCIERLRRNSVANARLEYFEGVVADQMNMLSTAIKHWRRSIELGEPSAQVKLALAGALARSGDRQGAARQLRALIAEDPRNPQLQLELSRVLVADGDYAEAEKHARAALSAQPADPEAALMFVIARMRQLAQGDTDADDPAYQQIENQLDRLAGATNNAPSVMLQQFRLALLRGLGEQATQLLEDMHRRARLSSLDLALARVELIKGTQSPESTVEALREVIEDYPNSTGPVKRLVRLLHHQGRTNACQSVINDALAHSSAAFVKQDLTILLADLYDVLNMQDEACRLLGDLAEQAPDDIAIKRRLLRYKQVAADPARADELIEQIKHLEGENGLQWRFEQARLWFEGDDFESTSAQSISLLKENLQADPADQASRVLLAAAYERSGNLQAAVTTYRDAYARSPRDLAVIIGTVSVLNKAAEFDEAAAILSRAAGEKLYHPSLSRLQLEGVLGTGQLDSAVDILAELRKHDPENRQYQLMLASIRMEQGQLQEAENLLNDLMTSRPDWPAALVAMTELKVNQKDYTAALQLCGKLVEISSDATGYLIRGRVHSLLGRHEDARKDYMQAAAIAPDNADVWTSLSDFHLSVGQGAEAIHAIQKALSLVPDNLTVQKRAVRLLGSAGDPELTAKAALILDNALQEYPKDVQLLLYQARLLMEGQNRKGAAKAMNVLQQVLDSHPDSTEAYELMGRLFLLRKQPGKAIDLALRGLAVAPHDKSLLLLKARSEAAGSPELAIPTFNALLDLYPNDMSIVVSLANAYVTSDDPAKAITLIETHLDASGAPADRQKLQIALATALYAAGDTQGADSRFGQLMTDYPDDPRCILAHARMLMDSGSYTELLRKLPLWYNASHETPQVLVSIAYDLSVIGSDDAMSTSEQFLRFILDKQPDSTEAMEALGVLLQTTDRATQAEAIYRQTLQLAPDKLMALNNLAWILCETRQNYREALDLAEQGLKLRPDYVDLIDTRGMVYYRLGRLDRAVKDFTTCIEMYPDGTAGRVGSYFHLGRAQAQLGQKYEAAKHLQRALSLDERSKVLGEDDVTEAKRLLGQLRQGV